MPSPPVVHSTPPGADSPRVRLARLALEAALAAPNVVAAEAGLQGMRVTADGAGGVLRGVSVISEGGGRYGVDLCLVACVAPLVALGEEVRRRVRASARRDGLDGQLGSVNVEFAGVLTPVEVSEAELRASELAAAAPLSTRATAAPSGGVAPPAGGSPPGPVSSEAPASRPGGPSEGTDR